MDISTEKWNDVMQQIYRGWWSLYYAQHKEDIDKSLWDFTEQVFARVAEIVEETGNSPVPEWLADAFALRKSRDGLRS